MRAATRAGPQRRLPFDRLTHDQGIEWRLVPYLVPYGSCLMRLMCLLDVLGVRG